MKGHLPRPLAALCSDQVPITANLFGANLAGSLKEAKELDRLTQTAGTSQRALSGGAEVNIDRTTRIRSLF